MFKVDNKKTINKLVLSSFKSNKLRNVFAITAIVLTTVLFTGLFTVTSSLIASMEESTMRQVGGSSHGTFKYISEEQYEKIKTHPSIKEIYYSVVLAIGENPELAKRPSEIRYISSDFGAASSFSLPTTGRLPQNDNEIATDDIVLKKLGVPLELGQEVVLEYSLNGEKQKETFTLVGFWQGDILMSASQVWLNQSYVENKLAEYPHMDNELFGTLNAEVFFANSHNIEEKLLKVIADSGFSKDDIAIGVNWAYTGNSGSTEIGTIIGGVVAISIIILCGYLIISNVFLISIAKDIRFYGLLKTIGTTGKQIKSFIYKQAIILCMVAIPLGLLAGYFVGVFLTPIVLSIINTNTIKISVSFFVFGMSAIFSVLTLLISIAKPSKIAAKVSPIEALRTTDNTAKTKRSNKKSTAINSFNMAIGNVLRNKKKTILVTISLSLSLIILNSAYSISNSFDMDKYLSGMIGSDFAVGDISNFNVHIHYANQDALSPQFLEELASKEGVEEISNIYFAEPYTKTDPRLFDMVDEIEKNLDISGTWLEYIKHDLENPRQIQHIYGLDQNIFDRINILEGELDTEKFMSGKYVIAEPYNTSNTVKYYNIGDKVNITNEVGEIKEYEVLAIGTIPYNISNQHSHPITPSFLMPSHIFLQDIVNKTPMLTTVNVEDSFEPKTEVFLSDYCENVDINMAYKSKQTYMAEYEATKQTYKSVGIVISSLVAFIGIVNFINTIITSIIARKKELAMLSSIGMENRQIKAMLTYEGLIYTLFTGIFALTIGSVISYGAVTGLVGGGLYITIKFTALPSLLALPFLAAFSGLVPFICWKFLSKTSVVERLREE